MKLLTFIAVTVFSAATLPSPAADTSPLSVAVFDFESKDEKDIGGKVATLINAFLSADANIMLVERAELEKALGEQELGMSGTVSAETAAKVGHLTGAKVLITGKVFKVDKEQMIVTKIIGTETSRVYGEIVKGAATSTIDTLAEQASKKISDTIASKADTLVAKVPTREDRVNAITKALKDAKRPSIAVRIPEQHFGAPVVDPAAETELSLILQQAGFTLVDEKSNQKADVEITGEAFSAYGMRRGNLISCKARVELKVRKMADGKILAVDRETTIAVDIAEQTAAKTALQSAGAQLAARLAPKLVAN